MATLGHDVAGRVGVAEGDAVQGQVFGGDEDAQGGEDGGDVGVVGAVVC